MDLMSDPFFVLVFLGFLVLGLAVVGHVLWLIGAAIIKTIIGPEDSPTKVILPEFPRCQNCSHSIQIENEYCGFCGQLRLTAVLYDLAATERQLRRFLRSHAIYESVYTILTDLVEAERRRLTNTTPASATEFQSRVMDPEEKNETADQSWTRPEWQTVSTANSDPDPIPSAVADSTAFTAEPAPSFLYAFEETNPDDQEVPPSQPPSVIQPRRRFTDMLNAFMEESNIRWGEVIGGLLIIGCSTALVVSLWAQISQIPVLKFLIFTTVTAMLFGIGLYTEHRWKLPNTSRGVLTIATLLVPLNFLAIAAVSSGTTSGVLVIGSEVIAPAVFLSLVYCAGRVITPGCASLLSSGILLSSIGQLLVRHFGSAEISPAALVALAAFPVVSYVAAVSLALRNLLLDRQIDEVEARTIFTMLGTMSFAALLPFGLLLHKAGPIGMTMMYVAPIVSLWGLPLLITGAVLWRRILNSQMVASRTTGTVLAILGAMVLLGGVVLAWPNPASIVPAALLSFAVFTVVALVLDLPVGHFVAAVCVALAYTVMFQVYSGQVPWTNLRVLSLWQLSLSAETGQAMVGIFFVFVVAAEWFTTLRKNRDSLYYLLAASVVMIVSLGLVTAYGLSPIAGPYHVWVVYLCYALGAFWIGGRRGRKEFSWVGSALLLFSLTQAFSQILQLSFPWQTSLLVHASICASVSIFLSRRDCAGLIHRPLSQSALLSLVLGVICLFQANTWQVTDMQARRVFWIAAILLLLLWNYRKHLLFVAFQIAATTGVILTVKAMLQAADWYAYLPYVFLHPRGLQIQGTVLLLVGLVWIALRVLCRRCAEINVAADKGDHWSIAAWRLLDTRYSIDRIVSWTVLAGFLLLVIYGAASGVTQELAAYGSDYAGFDLAGFPRQEVLGFGSWIVFGLLIVTMLAHSWERRRSAYVLAAMVGSAAIVPLLAGRFEAQVATASAWRWLSVAFLILVSIALWTRTRISRELTNSGWPKLNVRSALLSQHLRTVLLLVTLVPLALLTAYPALRAIFYLPVQGPASGVFSFLDIGLSYSFPLAIVAVVLVGYAIRERQAAFALAGGLSLNLTVTVAYLLNVVTVGGLMDRNVLVRLLQLNAITAGLYALAWLKYRRQWEAGLDTVKAKTSDHMLNIQVALTAGLNVLLVLPAVAAMALMPGKVGPGTFAVGSLPGWIALATGVAAVVWSRANRRVSASVFSISLAAFVCLLSLTVADIDVETFSGLRCLTVSATVLAWLLFAASRDDARRWLVGLGLLADSWQLVCRRYAVGVGVIAAGLALHPQLGDPSRNWWSIAPLLAVCGLGVALHYETLKRRYLFAAAILFNLTSSLWWLSYVSARLPGRTAFLEGSITILSLSGILWLWLELRARRVSDEVSKTAHFSVHHCAAFISFLMLAGLMYTGWLAELGESPLLYFPRFVWLAVFSTVAILGACLWDRHARYAVAGLYLLGLIAGGVLLQQLALDSSKTIWAALILVALLALVSSALWRQRNGVLDLARRLRIPSRIDASTSELEWLTSFNIVAVGIVLGLGFWVDWQIHDLDQRLTAAAAVLIQALTCGLLAEGATRRRWQQASVALFAIGLMFFCWSWLTPGSMATWLNRFVIMAVEAISLTALFTLGLSRLRLIQKDWPVAVRASVPWLLVVGVCALFVCLGMEVSYQLNTGAVRLHLVSFATIGLTLVSTTVLFVLFALSRTRDPLNLTERGRMTYVYAAEIVLALLFVHVRLTMPWLFGSLERYWPFIVMAIAYAGVIISEYLSVRRLEVLARPVEITGTFLPLLPLIGFWVVDSQVDYSALLFVGAGLYGLLSMLRRSFRFGVTAAICGNGGLWYYLQRTNDYQFLQHPQFWLVPVALSVLLAAYLNRDDFTEDQMMTTRYLALATIYLSSTADIIINGVVNSPWLPLILASFSLAGIFAGIVLRIRGMLLMGALFLLFAIITMIWFASVNFGWTWLWYVAGIFTGATIIFMFAVFEKKRSEVLRVVEGLRDWER